MLKLIKFSCSMLYRLFFAPLWILLWHDGKYIEIASEKQSGHCSVYCCAPNIVHLSQNRKALPSIFGLLSCSSTFSLCLYSCPLYSPLLFPSLSPLQLLSNPLLSFSSLPFSFWLDFWFFYEILFSFGFSIYCILCYSLVFLISPHFMLVWRGVIEIFNTSAW